MAPLIAMGAALLPSLIEAIAGDRAGKVADKVVDAVRTATGTDDPAEAEAALAGLTPDARAALRARLAEIAVEARRADLADVASARQQTVTLAASGSRIAWAAPIVSVMIVAGFLGVLFLLLRPGGEAVWHPQQAAVLNVIVGVLGAAFSAVVNYWLGSSAGSKASGDAVRAIATGAGVSSGPPIATTGPVTVNPPRPLAPPVSEGEMTGDEANRRWGGAQR